MISGLAHVNILVPPGTLAQADHFYGETLGLKPREVPKLQKNSLRWFDIGDSGQQVHVALGMNETKSSRHPCFKIESPDALLQLRQRIWEHFTNGGPAAPQEADRPGDKDSAVRLFTNICTLPFYTFLFIFSSQRPCRQWTYKQAISVHIIRLVISALSLRGKSPPAKLEPGAEGDRFVVIPPAVSSTYKEITRIDREIQPAQTGATWYPSRPQKATELEQVVLHFHGGAYVIGDGREQDAGFLARTLLKAGKGRISHVLCSQYRLSAGDRQGRFPAALQDALTCYAHLVRTQGVAPERIVVSGDSAGANLSLALLRYLESYGESLGLKPPGNVWLWSPWLDAVASSKKPSDSAPHFQTDYVTEAFGHWGASCLMPDHSTGVTIHNPYIQAYGNPFATTAKVFVHTGGLEFMANPILTFVEQMRSVKGNVVEDHLSEYGPHDIILLGEKLGFEREALEAAKAAVQSL
ncbi:hypothetical protein KC343_g6397 [Hortaea werneckii]|nr:hypothetical protein KC343_g6397 [Hortaea werneckii]